MKKLLFAAILIASSARAEVDAKVARTFKAKCASCHGADGRGETEQGKKLKVANMADAGWQKGNTDAQIKTAITDGVKKDGTEMEGYKDKLDGAAIDGLVQFIRTLK